MCRGSHENVGTATPRTGPSCVLARLLPIGGRNGLRARYSSCNVKNLHRKSIGGKGPPLQAEMAKRKMKAVKPKQIIGSTMLLGL